MVRANRANRNIEIHTPLSSHPPAEDRGSMHPSRPLDVDWAARWLRGQPWATPAARRLGRAGGAARALHARIPRRGRGAALTRSDDAAGTASTTCLVKDQAQGFLVRIDDAVDEPFARGRMQHQEFDRSLRPSGRAARTGIAFFKTNAALSGERLLSRDQRVHVVLSARGPPGLAALGEFDRPPRAMGCLRGLMRDDL